VPHDNEWISPSELAAMFQVPVKTVYAWNYVGSGPPSYRIGRHVRYRRSEAVAWAEAHATEPRPAA
jgi:predicted DNA-binding transcriptional regulator AlpA